MSNVGFIIAKTTASGNVMLYPLSEINGDRGKKMMKNDPMAWRVNEVMSFLIKEAKRGGHTSLKAMYDAASQHWDDRFIKASYLIGHGSTPARIIVKE